MDIRGLNFTPNMSNPIEQGIRSQNEINTTIGNITVHSQAEYDALVQNMNQGFQFAAQKFGIWIDLLFLGVCVFVLMRAVIGLNHKRIELSEGKLKLFTQIEGIALTYVCMMALYLFALQWVPYFS